MFDLCRRMVLSVGGVGVHGVRSRFDSNRKWRRLVLQLPGGPVFIGSGWHSVLFVPCRGLCIRIGLNGLFFVPVRIVFVWDRGHFFLLVYTVCQWRHVGCWCQRLLKLHGGDVRLFVGLRQL